MERMPKASDQFLSPKEVAQILGLTWRGLANMRSTGRGPEYVRVSRSCVRYSLESVQRWMAENTVRPGQESAAA
jgi:predicted DNA-binding transcriptional regulator AlpA